MGSNNQAEPYIVYHDHTDYSFLETVAKCGGPGPDVYLMYATMTENYVEELKPMIEEPLEEFTDVFMDQYDGPWADDGEFLEVPPDDIFDKPADTLTNIWFLCLLLTGRLEGPEFTCNGEKITVVHEGYLMFFDGPYREDCCNPDADPVRLFEICLKVLDMVVSEVNGKFWPIKLAAFAKALGARL